MKRNTQNEAAGSAGPGGTGKTQSGPLSARAGKSVASASAPTDPIQNKKAAQSLVRLRSYQLPIFRDRKTGVLLLHWSRQIGKSHVLAAWAVDRLLENPGRLVTVLSNTLDNGAEFVQKAAEFARLLGVACETEDQSPDVQYQNMRMEVRITVGGKTGRIKVLAANPRTARGFSGDLILDEFAFHEDSAAIWDAAEPIISSNPEFLCRIASTGNGKHNMFYRFTAGAKAIEGEPNMYLTEMGFKLSRMPRTEAHRQGVKVYDPNTRQPITPDEARSRAADKRSYDQNYECVFTDENSVLLTHELISAAETDGIGVLCEQDWSGEALNYIAKASGPVSFGVDVGRSRDLTVITAVESQGPLRLVRAVLRIQGMRLPDQQRRLGEALKSAKQFQAACIDMTGLGIGLVEYAQDEFGARIHGINFATTVPTTQRIKQEGRKQETVRVTEAMATELLQVYEDRLIKHPADQELREDLRKPEKIVSPGGRVSIAATRDEAGHADHFWSFALAIEAGRSSGFNMNPIAEPRRITERSCRGA